MKKVCKYIFLLILIGVACFSNLKGESQIIVAETNNTEIVNEVIESYKKNSLSYQRIEMEQKLNISTYLEYKNNLKQYEEQIVKAQGEAETIENLKKAYEECLLNVNIYEFYQNNSGKLIVENQNKEMYNFLQDFLKLPVYKANIKYYKELIKELKDELSITEYKYKKGYATELEVKSLKSTLNTEMANLNSIEGELLSLQAKINMDTGLTGEYDFSLYKLTPIQREEEYLNEYFADSPLLFQEQKEKAYTTYKENVTNKLKDSSIYIEKADNNLILIGIEKKQYKNKITNTVSGNIVSYNNMSQQLNNKKEEIKVLNLKISSNKKLYKKGKIQKLKLTKLSTEKAKLEYEETLLLYKQNMAYYALEYHIVQ